VELYVACVSVEHDHFAQISVELVETLDVVLPVKCVASRTNL
jgi:hypothetical protein